MQREIREIKRGKGNRGVEIGEEKNCKKFLKKLKSKNICHSEPAGEESLGRDASLRSA